jgi:hypothetical protein
VIDRCEKSFRARSARNDFSLFGLRFARPKQQNLRQRRTDVDADFAPFAFRDWQREALPKPVC